MAFCIVSFHLYRCHTYIALGGFHKVCVHVIIKITIENYKNGGQ